MGERKHTTWEGFSAIESTFSDRSYILVKPHAGKGNGKWALKTEYFGAFPALEIELLKRGYHIAHIKTKTRWCLPEDTEAQADFVRFIHKEFELCKTCVPIGMSCGGMQSIYLAAKHPALVSCAYLDAPVLNLLSCPAGVGGREALLNREYAEFVEHRGMTVSELVPFREHPQDYLPQMVAARIPVVLVSGDSDTIVPFHENGRLLAEAYEEAGVPIEVHIKPGGDHHPHGLADNTLIADFIDRFS